MLPVTSHGSQSLPFLESLGDTALRIWENLKEYWNAFVDWASSTSVAFWVFRSVEAIYPSLSAKLESGYLYVTQFFRDFFAQQREATLQQELQRLTTETAELQAIVLRLGREKREVEEAYQEFRGRAEVQIDVLETRLRHSEGDVRTQAQEIEALRTALAAREDSSAQRLLALEKALNKALKRQIAEMKRS